MFSAESLYMTGLCHSYRSVCCSEQWTELIGASHLFSEGHCCLLIQCHDKLATIKPYTRHWVMSLCLCMLHVHLNISFSEPASLIFGNQISIRFKWMTKMRQLGQGRGLDWWAEGWEMKGGVQTVFEDTWKEMRVYGSGGEGQRCSSIISHNGPGVGFSKTDSERSGSDSITHKSWHVTLMDVGHKASPSDMWRATWRTMGKCECSR